MVLIYIFHPSNKQIIFASRLPFVISITNIQLFSSHPDRQQQQQQKNYIANGHVTVVGNLQYLLGNIYEMAWLLCSFCSE